MLYILFKGDGFQIGLAAAVEQWINFAQHDQIKKLENF